jgi:hypothetical protein
MEAVIVSLDAAHALDRKYMIAFLKGLSAIKYHEYFAKANKDKANEEEEEPMELEFLYGNLFDEDTTSPEDFNTLVENGMKLLSEIVSTNMDKEGLDTFLTRKVSGKDEHKKAVQMFWK